MPHGSQLIDYLVQFFTPIHSASWFSDDRHIYPIFSDLFKVPQGSQLISIFIFFFSDLFKVPHGFKFVFLHPSIVPQGSQLIGIFTPFFRTVQNGTDPFDRNIYCSFSHLFRVPQALK